MPTKCEILMYLAKFSEVIMINRAINLNCYFNTFKYLHHKHKNMSARSITFLLSQLWFISFHLPPSCFLKAMLESKVKFTFTSMFLRLPRNPVHPVINLILNGPKRVWVSRWNLIQMLSHVSCFFHLCS